MLENSLLMHFRCLLLEVLRGRPLDQVDAGTRQDIAKSVIHAADTSVRVRLDL